MKKYYGLSVIPFLLVWLMMAPPHAKRSFGQGTAPPQADSQQSSAALVGQSKTLLPDGHWLILGGESGKGVVGTAAIEDAATGVITPLSLSLLRPRAWHTATLLPNGIVFIFGGLGDNGKVVTTAELFDPVTRKFQLVNTPGLTPRAHHTATLLTDGSVLIVGGSSESGETLSLAESWSWQTSMGAALPRSLLTPRRDDVATLLPDGEVLFWGGLDSNAVAINYGEEFDPKTLTFRIETNPLQPNNDLLSLEESIPADGSENVPTDTIIALRFSKPLLVTTVNVTTGSLSGPTGALSVQVVPAEGGMLAFLTPQTPLMPATSYSLMLSGLTDPAGNALPQTSIDFTTTGAAPGVDNGIVPVNGTDGNEPVDGQTQNLPPLQARPGVTALSGQSLKLSGSPLEDLTIQDEGSGVKAETDETGRFLLKPLSVGHHVLFVDGRTARSAGDTYGTYEIGVDIAAGKTTVLNYKIWMTALDRVHAVRISSPTISDVVVSNPSLPGLELHIPKGTVITDHNGKVVSEISITPIPLSQPPFPLPQGVPVPIYFTIQPGAAYLQTNSGTGTQGAQLYYPNTGKASLGTPFDFWNYDPDVKGWYVYGHGKVGTNVKQIIPDPGVYVYEFTGAMIAGPGVKPQTAGAPGGPNKGSGDPVDISTGLFEYTKTDMVISDILPISLTRTYRQADSISRAFGVGSMHPYDIYLVGTTFPYTYQELILPNGGSIRYDRVSAGTSFADAVYVHSSTTTSYYGSTITWNGNGWNLTMKDGTVYLFPDGFGASRAQQSALIGIRDRYNNILNIARDSNSNITQITTPNGRWIQFTYDSSYRITQASDNVGRSVSYSYDSGGRLTTVSDAKGGTTNYTYDSNGNMLTVTDPRGLTYLINVYDSNNRIIKQTMADGSTFQFAYTLSSNSSQTHFVTYGSGYSGGGPGIDILGFRACQGCAEGYTPLVSQVDVTDQRGYVRRVVFNGSGYPATDTRALDQPEQQTTIYTYYPDNLIESVTDPVGRTTSYVYDVNNNVTQVTRLSGTPNAVTTSFTYEPAHNQVATATDPLGHTTIFDHDNNGNLVAVVDPLSQETSFTYNAAGQPLSATDALNNKTTFAYDSGDLVSITDPLSRTTTRFLDGAGRLVTVTNPLGQSTRNDYDALNEITKVTDPAGNTTSFSYDGNGDLLSVTDANNNTTTYTYDNMDRLLTRTDPLTNTERYQYDAAGNLVQFADRRGKVTTYSYDSLNRKTLAGFGTAVGTPNTYDSSIAYSYDAGNRLLNVVDSGAGTITPEYDVLDRLISEQTPQGTVSYTYDLAGRRTQMTVAGQGGVNYAYDNANRLMQITQGGSTVSFAYDAGNRRTALTLPNGIVMSYSYDNASELTGINYTNGSTNLGSLTYGYDLAGRRTSMGGSLAQTALPLAVNEAEYNANNQLTEWGTASLFYDPDGNMTSDGLNSYVWNSRNQLASMNSGANSFQYDAYGRRASKTTSSTTTNFLYDGANIVQELSGTTPTANLLTGGIDEVFTRTDSSGAANFLTDALGSTLALISSSGTTLAQYAYDSFGNTTVTSGSSTNSYEYTGRENDGAGLYFYRARHYSPVIQRFISEDPLGLSAGPNLFAYALNSPINLKDPFGMDTAQLGISGTVTLLGITFTGSVGIALDGHGNIGTYSSSGASLGLGANASVGISGAYSNADDITGLGGKFGNVSVSGGDVVSGTVDAFAGPGNGPGGIVTGVGATGGFGFGGAASAGYTDTTVTPRIGPLAPPASGCNTSGACGGGGFGPDAGGSGRGGSTAGRKG